MHSPERALPLELDGAAFERLMAAVMPRLVHALDTLDEGPAAALDTAVGEAVALALKSDAPETGGSVEAALGELFDRALPHSYHTGSGRYLAYIPGGGIPTAAVADLIAGIINRYVTVWVASPGLIQLEQNVIDWLSALVGYGDGAGGLLTTGGSMANFSAVVAARESRLEGPLERGVAYVSAQVHHSVQKAAQLAGIRPSQVRSVPCNESMQMSLSALRVQIAHDLDDGYHPFLVVGSAGTTNTGAIDELSGLAGVAREHGMWFHVDAAYGGFFLLSDQVRTRFAGIEHADSVTLDPHKGLFLPYGTGALVVRDRATLTAAHDVGAEYLPQIGGSPIRVDYSAMGPELSRAFRGIRVWLPLRLHGLSAFRTALDEKLELAERFDARVSNWPHIRVVPGSHLSVRAFRYEPPGWSDERLDELNQRWLERVNARQRTHLSGTRLNGRYVLRVAILNFRTHASHVDMALDDLEETLAELTSGR